ncbi:MAG: hypothetical protein KC618_08490 [Candidatus Omnitrophica bacterium]|nr:hypothetical protein [Candidatus Omnitrophota bacterium]
MPTFKYTGKNQEAKTVTGKIAAESKEAVIEELRKRKLTITSLVELKGAAAGGKKSAFRG